LIRRQPWGPIVESGKSAVNLHIFTRLNGAAMCAKHAIISSFLSLLTIASFGQDQSTPCLGMHQGIFYYYPKNTSDQYSLRLDASYEHQTDLTSGDTALYHIKWQGCSFSEKYVASNITLTREQLKVLRHNTFVYKITGTTNDYAMFTVYMDGSRALLLTEDTLWDHPRSHPTNSKLFTPLNKSLLRQTHFKDTSGYAILYLYRPEKVTHLLNVYPVAINNIVMCIAQNNSGYIFKILKEGRFVIKAGLFNDPYYMTLSIRFGHSYYLKTQVHPGGTKDTTRAILAVVDPKMGREEFEKVKVRY
jgi:hypothetical protein